MKLVVSYVYFIVIADVLYCIDVANSSVCLSVHVDCFDVWSWGVFLEAMKVCGEEFIHVHAELSTLTHSVSINLTSLTHTEG